MPSPLYCRLDQVPSSADQFICGVAPSITARSFSSGPSDSTSRWTPCPPENCKAWLQVHLGCIRLSSLCPCRLLHTFRFLRPATYYRRFWIQRSSSERRRDFNPPDQCAAQRKIHTRRFHRHVRDSVLLQPVHQCQEILGEGSVDPQLLALLAVGFTPADADAHGLFMHIQPGATNIHNLHGFPSWTASSGSLLV